MKAERRSEKLEVRIYNCIEVRKVIKTVYTSRTSA